LFLLVTHPRDAGKIGHQLNEFERRQLGPVDIKGIPSESRM
jgi:hypothetical protein